VASLHRFGFLGRILKVRFMRFGAVGASGTLVNLAMVYVGQEYLFTAVQSFQLRLNISLGLAICAATINNFAWNRAWTWADRERRKAGRHLLVQFGQYALACWLGIAAQVVITNLLAAHLHYLTANLTAIVLASVINFIVNDRWTFSGRYPFLGRRLHIESTRTSS
jgi:putative flippase GtrA